MSESVDQLIPACLDIWNTRKTNSFYFTLIVGSGTYPRIKSLPAAVYRRAYCLMRSALLSYTLVSSVSVTVYRWLIDNSPFRGWHQTIVLMGPWWRHSIVNIFCRKGGWYWPTLLGNAQLLADPSDWAEIPARGRWKLGREFSRTSVKYSADSRRENYLYDLLVPDLVSLGMRKVFQL